MKMKKKMFVLLLVLCLSCTSAISVSAASIDTDYDEFISKASHSSRVDFYKDWITSQINRKDLNGYKPQIFLNEFNNLTEDEQESFVSYISNSDLLLEMLNSLFNTNNHVELANGDIVISNSQTLDNGEKAVENRAAMQYRIGTATRSISILGLKVFEYSGEIRYNHNGSAVKGISHANIWISANWMPFVSFSWDNESTYGIGATVAHHIKYCTWSFVHESLGLTYGSHQIEITGSVSNRTTFSVR